MQASLTATPSPSFFGAASFGDRSSSEPTLPGRKDGLAAATVDSSALLQGQKTVAICHNGAIYRLQATKLGKLILTK